MSTGISRAIRCVFRVIHRSLIVFYCAVGLLAAAILLGFFGLFIAGRMGAFADYSDYSNCMIAARAEVVDELREGDQTLYLVYRVTGWTDKVATYSLFAAPPIFDTCGYPRNESLDMDTIEDDGDRWVKDVLVRNTKKHGPRLEIRYTRQADEGVSVTQAKLIRGDGLEPNPDDNPRLWDDDSEDKENAGDAMETGRDSDLI